LLEPGIFGAKNGLAFGSTPDAAASSIVFFIRSIDCGSGGETITCSSVTASWTGVLASEGD
jgi:hypothetical protein